MTVRSLVTSTLLLSSFAIYCMDDAGSSSAAQTPVREWGSNRALFAAVLAGNYSQVEQLITNATPLDIAQAAVYASSLRGQYLGAMQSLLQIVKLMPTTQDRKNVCILLESTRGVTPSGAKIGCFPDDDNLVFTEHTDKLSRNYIICSKKAVAHGGH